MSARTNTIPKTGSKLDITKSVEAVEMSVEVLIFLIFKAFAAMRTYRCEHPIFKNALQHLTQTFDEFFEAHDQLKIELSESEILFQGQAVYQEAEKRGSLIFMLFNEGVREIRFEKELTHEEIREFLDALKTNAELPHEGRDIVSLLWSKDFRHIHYFAFDEIPDQEVDYVDKGISELECNGSVIDFMDTTSICNDVKSEMEKSESETGQTTPLFKSPILPDMKMLDNDCLEDLVKDLNRGDSFDTQGELIHIIFDVLRLEENVDRALPILKLLEDYSDELLNKGALAQMNRIIQALRDLVHHWKTISSPSAQYAESVLRKFSEQEKLTVLQEGLRDVSTISTEDLRTFVTLLHPIAIGPICTFLGEIEDPKLRGAICLGLQILAKGETSLLAEPLRTATEMAAKDIVAVLGRIGDESAIQILRTCVNHSNASVREETIRALRTMNYPQTQQVFIQFLRDDDPAIRTAAAEGLETFDTYCDIDPVLDIVKLKKFNKRSFREKKALLSVLGKDSSSKSIGLLQRLLSKKNLLNRKKYDEMRVCAALALGKANSKIARDLLERFSLDSSPAVRKVCLQATRTERSQQLTHELQTP